MKNSTHGSVSPEKRGLESEAPMSIDAFQTSGTSPTQQHETDFVVENHGSIFLLQPLTPVANFWISEHLPEDRMTFGSAVVVEPRYIADIVRGAQADGLAVGQ